MKLSLNRTSSGALSWEYSHSTRPSAGLKQSGEAADGFTHSIVDRDRKQTGRRLARFAAADQLGQGDSLDRLNRIHQFSEARRLDVMKR